jgi:hypothetical protein
VARPTEPAKPKPQIEPGPFKYYVGKEVLLVEVTTIEKVTRAIEVVPREDAQKRCDQFHLLPDSQRNDLCVTSTPITLREARLSAKLVPDPSLGSFVAPQTAAMTDTGTTLELGDGMLLRSINLTSTGRAGEIVTFIAKFAGTIVGLPNILGGASGLRNSLLQNQLFRQGIIDEKGNPTGTRKGRAVTAKCDPFAKPYADQPDPIRLYLWENTTACQNFNRILEIQEVREDLITSKLTLDRKLITVTSNEFEALKKLLDQTQASIDTKDKDLKERHKLFTTQSDMFVKTLNLGTESKTTTYGQTLELSKLPVSTGFSDQMTEVAAEAQITSLANGPITTLWNGGKVVVTYDPIDAACSDSSGKELPAGVTKDKAVNIYFRQGRPARLRAFISDKPDPTKDAVLRAVEDRFDTFVDSCGLISQLTFTKSAWSKRDFTLEFDAKGRPKKLVHTSTASVAALASTVAASATAFRDELGTTLTKAVEIQENRRKLALDDLNTQIAKVKAEKDLLDAQLSLDAAAINIETVLKQKEADARLVRLNSELALANAEATRSQNEEIAHLKVAIEAINQQMALLSAKTELEAKIKK